MNSDIEGTLFKWTNYWGGWQARWVVLHNGILSYYNSSDEVSKGCRASIKISASDIVAYPTDNTRLDVVVPNEQRWYLKASNPAERQAWLIALGTSKANAGKEDMQQGQGSPGAYDELRSTMNEVRLFCDLLVQQAVKVKEESLKTTPDATVLSDSSVLLSTTCDTFLAALGRCITVSETTLGVPTPHNQIQRPPPRDGQYALPQISLSKTKHKKRNKSTGQSSPTTPVYSGGSDLRMTSSNPTHPPLNELGTSPSATSLQTTSSGSYFSGSKVGTGSSSTASHVNSVGRVELPRAEVLDGRVSVVGSFHAPGDDEETMLTFFSGMLHSFSDIVLQEDGGIPTTSFLAACEGIVPFLETIGSTAFAPVRMDFMGNISKLKTKHASNAAKFQTLQKILEQELKTSTTKVRNSATDALMWLKRGLRFMQKFLVIFKDGERNLTLALNQAYSVTLKPYHGWVVKGIFALAVKAAPYPNDFIKALATNRDHAQDRRFLGILLEDIDQYTTAMDVVLNIVDNFYESHQLESSAIV